MALITCNECGAQVSATAKACPRCGAPYKKMLPPCPPGSGRIRKILVRIAIGYVVVVVLAVVIFVKPKPLPQPTAAEKRAQSLDQLAGVNAVYAAKAVKAAARNPGSVVFDQILTNDDGTVICLTYRGQNGFGGMSREQVVFVDGKPHSNGATWNKHCRRILHDKTGVAGWPTGL